MADEAATPTGGAEGSVRSEAPPSVHDRLKSAMFGSQETEPRKEPERAAPPVETEAAQKEQPAKAEAEVEVQEETPTDEPQDEALTAAELRTLNQLAEATGLDLDKIMDLDIPTKIDGKEGIARLRDMVKSYQLEGHLTNKLTAFADEKKAFETERQTFTQTTQQKLMQMDAGVQLAQRLLDGEFANINWQELQATDRLEFNQKVVEYQQRQGAIKSIADQIGAERRATEEQTAKQQQAYLQEQFALLDTKVPEWADKAKKAKDITEMAGVLKDAYGISEKELRSRTDHREILVMRDAYKWQQLQKSKTAIVNKVRTAPKLLKPGTQQSRAAQDGFLKQKAQERLRQTGRVQDARPILKRILFNS